MAISTYKVFLMKKGTTGNTYEKLIDIKEFPDLGGDPEKVLAHGAASVAGAVLVAGRHGDAAATSLAWLEAVRSQDVIISAGVHSEERHPDADMLARLAERNIRVWRTDRQGKIQVNLPEKPACWPDPGYRIRAERP